MEKLAYMGVTINEEANNQRGKAMLISGPDSKVKVYVIPTDEELVIARDTLEIASR
jgi:acetate kinase